MKRKKKKFRLERINALLDSINGKSNDNFDRKLKYKFPKSMEKIYSVKTHKQLFNSLTVSDFNYLLGLKFSCISEVLKVLLPQSVTGRAVSGHGWFTDVDGYPIKFKDATFDRVLTSLENSYEELSNIFAREVRTNLIKEIFSFFSKNINTEYMELNSLDTTFFGIKFLKNKKVNTKAFFKGMIIAGFMDDYKLRQKTVEKYRTDFMDNIFDIGGGEQFVVNRKSFKFLGIKDPGIIEFNENDIEKLLNSQVVFSDTNKIFKYPEFDKMFFRFKDDYGISDDMALISIGAIYGYDAMLGAFIMDAVDTYEKYLIEFSAGGEDKNYAQYLQNYFKKITGKPLVNEDEIIKVIYLASKNNSPRTFLSSSHRRFIQIEKGATIPTLLNHWNFISGEAPVYDIQLGYTKVPAKKFYSIAYLRLKYAGINIKQPVFY